jgi:nucleotide-binding universal stress UspA family protein
MKKILIAIDNSEGSLKAADFIGQQFSGVSDCKITLLHVIPNLPAPLWDDGHILTEEERKARQQVIDKWLVNQELQIKPMFGKAIERMTKSGISRDQVETRTVADTLDVAGSILNEVRDGNYQMLAIGRHGYSKTERFIMGSVANAVINRGSGMAICIVE